MTYCFDIDGTLCTNTEGRYEEARALPQAVARVNALYDAGHRIVLHTARGSTTGIDWRVRTERQLRDWGVKYHELCFGKPFADLYVDDKALNAKDWLQAGDPLAPASAGILKDSPGPSDPGAAGLAPRQENAL